MNYYNDNAKAFIERSISIDMTLVYDKFLPYLPLGGTILDVGSGPGRDSKEFLTLGYKPTLIEPSSELSKYAKEYTNLEVIEKEVLNFETDQQFDGIWACASLLHLKSSELPKVFSHLYKLLKPSGVMYCSFKKGDFEGMRDGRWFTDLTEESLKGIVSKTNFRLKEIWGNTEVRAGVHVKWLNIILEQENV
jgi:SAM-dependent methyltransferase